MIQFWFRAAAKLILFGFLLVLAGCVNKAKKVPLIPAFHEQEARYYDIPIVVDAVPVFDITEQGMVVSYQTQLSVPDIILFYEAEMECFGWQRVWQFAGKETLLQFEKPSRWLSVSIRPEKKLNVVVIVSCMK